jgi:low temperature requirement protein LtrA
MLLVVDILILFSLFIIVFQDFKQRQISWFLIPLLFAGFVYKASLYKDSALTGFLFNAAFIVLQLICLTLYFSIKNKRFLNIIDTHLGLGDVLFFLVVCTVFSPLNFIAFYVCSMIITLVAVIAYNLFSSRQTKDIPLAGAMAGALMILLLTTIAMPGVDFYNDGYLLNIIRKL